MHEINLKQKVNYSYTIKLQKATKIYHDIYIKILECLYSCEENENILMFVYKILLRY